MKQIKIRVLEGLSLFVVRLHVKGRFPVEYLSSRNVVSDFDIFTAGVSASLQFGFYLNLVRFLLRMNLSRRNVWSRVAPSTLFNFRRIGNKQSIFITFHVFTCSTGCKYFTFLLRPWCKVTSVHTSPGSTQFCGFSFRPIHLLSPPPKKKSAIDRKWNLYLSP